MAVKLRVKEIKNGIQSYYLEYYHGYIKTENGKKNKRTYKFLNLYTIPNDAKHNKNVLKVAQNILTVENGKFLENKIHYVSSIDSKQPIIDVFKKYIKNKTTKSSVNVFHSSLNYLVSFFEVNQNRNKVIDIDKNLCEDYYLYLLNFKYQNILKISTVNSYFKKFRQLLIWLYDNDKLTKNPTKWVQLHKIPSIQKSNLTDFELTNLLSEKNKTCHQKAFLFACFTGLRYVDIHKLKYSDISIDNVNNKYYINIIQSKTGENLEILLTDDAISLINFNNEFIGKNMPIFIGLTYSDYNNKKLKEWIKIKGIYKKISFHSGRYTMIMRLVNNNTEPYYIQRILGHQSMLTTCKYINKLNIKHNQALEQLPRLSA